MSLSNCFQVHNDGNVIFHYNKLVQLNIPWKHLNNPNDIITNINNKDSLIYKIREKLKLLMEEEVVKDIFKQNIMYIMNTIFDGYLFKDKNPFESISIDEIIDLIYLKYIDSEYS